MFISHVLAAALISGVLNGAHSAPHLSVDRPDCPGKIICPLSGEPVCRDRCPLGESVAAPEPAADQLPACCRMRQAR
jgi:hypothetical protein